MGSKSKPPPAPDPAKVAAAQGAENRKTTQLNAAYNRPNQIGPYGESVSWSQNGTDANGNPIFTQRTELGQLGQEAGGGLAALGRQYFDRAGNLGDLTSDSAFQQALQFGEANLVPRFDRQRLALEQQLRNQGLDPTSAAWQSRMNDNALQQNEALNDLALKAQGQMFGQGMQSRALGMSELQPGVSFMGQRAGNPQFTPFAGVSSAPVDVAGITQQGYQNQLAQYNANQAQNNAMWGGLAGIGGTIMGLPMGGGMSLGGRMLGGLLG